MLVEYHSNNSGGDWWLKDKDWKALEKAGWFVVWAGKDFVFKDGNHLLDKNGLPTLKDGGSFCSKDESGVIRYMGSLARPYAYKHFDSPVDAIKEFEKITGQDVMDEGCNCCGAPHTFSWKGGYCSGEGCGEYLFGVVS